METKYLDVGLQKSDTSINSNDPEFEEIISSRPDSRTVSIRQWTYRDCTDRYFGKLAKGSMRGSIFALCSGAIGTGVLSLPYVLKINGWIVGIVLIMLGAFGKTSISCLLYSIWDELRFTG